MPTAPPLNPDVRRQLKQRLLALSPRAFELFAGDLLGYIGLENVMVTRYVGDGGIDAHGDLIAASSLVRVPTGVQVKRHHNNVRRPDIDQFIGALGGHFNHGIFITTADYAPQAKIKAASSPIIRVDTVDGDQVAALMTRHSLGIQTNDTLALLDEDYFLGFEALASAVPMQVREANETYQATLAEDLISLRALSYALHVDMQTIRRGWIETGKLQPDVTQRVGNRDTYFFRRDRLDAIRQQFALKQSPDSGVEWRQKFLDYARSRTLTRSYKPVLLKALLKLVDRNGEVQMQDLATEFLSFYVERQRQNQTIEFNTPLLDDPSSLSLDAIKRLIEKYPLDRFVTQNFVEYEPTNGVVRFTAQLWSELRLYESLDIRQHADEQIDYYYSRER